MSVSGVSSQAHKKRDQIAAMSTNTHSVAQTRTSTSDIIITSGTNFIKKHPVPVAAYVVGLLLCLLFNGISLSENQRKEFYKDVSNIDYLELEGAAMDVELASRRYSNSKGWFFTCNEECQLFKTDYEQAQHSFNTLKQREEQLLSNAKGKVGIFSDIGVTETRNAFWNRFNQGKQFAKSQSKFDMYMYGFRAMMRDESLVSYLLSMLIRVLFNFTLGVVIAVVSFIWTLIGVIRTFQASPIAGILFFIGASIASIAFAVTCIVVLFGGAGGAVYVAVKLVAANARIEDGRRGQPLRFDRHMHRN